MKSLFPHRVRIALANLSRAAMAEANRKWQEGDKSGSESLHNDRRELCAFLRRFGVSIYI